MNRLTPSILASTLCFLSGTSHAEVVFSESFESPVVSGFATNTVPDNGNWIGSSGAFNATVRGLYDDFVAWPATPVFSTPFGDQGYFLDYSTTMLTTAQGATGQTITAGVTYTLTFNAAFRAGTSADYKAELVAFGPGDDNAARQSPNSPAGTVVASATGAITASDMSDEVTITFTPDATNVHLGEELGIRFDDADGSAIYDNVRLIVGHDFDPSPASGEDLSAGGNVTLSWTNLPPVAPATETYVDILFGTDPNALGLAVDGQLTGSTVVDAPQAGTYYWRIDAYPDGDPEGIPTSSNVYFFTIADTDGDGLPDEYELANTDPSSNTALDPASDLDTDELTAGDEYNFGTDPNDPDSDDDNLLDGPEIKGTAGLRPATNPLVADTDGDGLNDDVETNTGTWMSAADTGTNPVDVDWDKDGLLDGAETNTGILVDRFDTGTDPFDANTDGDNAGDWYEVAGSLTDPHNSAESSPIPYPLPDPDPLDTGAADKPVKVYILSGQSNMVGYGQVSGSGPGTLDTITKKENKFPNLLDAGGSYLPRQDVYYRGVISAEGNGPLAPGFARNGNSIGPELGFGQVMGWFHDEPVLVLKASIGNRGLQWDFLPPGSEQFDYAPNGKTYPAYGESPRSWTTGTTPEPINWYAGKEFDRFFLHKDDWAPAGASAPQDPNVATVLDDWANQYPDWAAQGFEIAGFGWFHGFDDANGTNGPEAGRYEQNMVRFIKQLRLYLESRYPGKGAASAPFVASTYIQGGPNRTPRALQVADALLNISGDAGNYPEFVGNVKTHESIAYWRDGSESPSGDGIHHHWNAETFMLVGDGMGRAMLTLQNDTSPPFPVGFEIPPSAVDATTVGMVATTASDPSGPVEYYFENITSGTDSGWTTETRWDNSGLAPGSYDYRFKVRDAEGNESDWSSTESASPGADITAPSPDPMSFASAPVATGEESITMIATTAADINGVEYEFVCTVGGGPGSGWQASPEFEPSGLLPGTSYTYVVRARDSVGNITADSPAQSATTDAPDLTAPTPDPMSFEVFPIATGETSITMTATTATDESGAEYEFVCTVGGGPSSGWQDSAIFEATGLSPGTEYTYTVRARDKSPAQNATAASAPASATTDVPDLIAPQLTSLNPANGASGVSNTANLELSFDEEVALGSGVIFIRNLTDESESTIDVTDASQVSVAGQVVSIDPDGGLAFDTDFAVRIADTAITDLAGNGFGGIDDDTTWAFTTASAPAVPLAVIYEPFAQAAGSLGGKPGGAGLTGNWSVNQTVEVVESPTFTYGDLPASGGQVDLPQGSGVDAWVSTSSGLADAGLLNDGASLWFSLMFMKTSGGGSNEHAGFAFGTERVDAAYNGARMNSGYGLGFYSRNNAISVANWNNGGSSNGGSLTIEYSTPEFIVGRIDWGAAPTDNETITLYNPANDDLGNLGAGVSKTIAGFDQSALDTVSFSQRNSGGTYSFDEIRFGASYESVLGQASGPPENTFGEWIAGFPGVGTLDGLDDDADGDGIDNGVENFFGTDPSSFSTGLVAGSAESGTFTFTHPISDDPADDVDVIYRWSSDLVNFTNDGVEAGGTTVSFAQGIPSGGMVTVTATVTGNPLDRLFVTVEASAQD